MIRRIPEEAIVNKTMSKNKFTSYASEVLYGELCDRFCWSEARRRYMFWDGKRWVPTTAFEMEIEASESLKQHWTVLRTIIATSNVPKVEERLQYVEELLTCAREKRNYVETALWQLRVRAGFWIAKDRWDDDRYLLNVQNGTVDMKTCTLQPHNPTDFITRLAPVEFMRDAEAPKWEAHLEHCLPDVDARLRMRRGLGKALVTGLRPLWYGGGNDGKYLTAMVLRRVLGDHAHPGWFPKLITAGGPVGWKPPVGYEPFTHWQHSVPKIYRGHISEVAADLLAESSGILWWLLNGVSSWLHYKFS